MGVYIEGMEMPKYCAECDAVDREELLCPFINDDCEDYFSVRNRNCPLSPVPPHGRLIDADAILQEATKGEEPFDWIDKNELLRLFFDAPTIIPAEEEMK